MAIPVTICWKWLRLKPVIINDDPIDSCGEQSLGGRDHLVAVVVVDIEVRERMRTT